VVAAWVLALNTGRDLAFSLAYLLSRHSLVAEPALGLEQRARAVAARRHATQPGGPICRGAVRDHVNQSFWPKLWLEMRRPFDAALAQRQPRRQRAAPQRHAALGGQARSAPSAGAFGWALSRCAAATRWASSTTQRPLSASGYVIVYPLDLEITSFAPSVSELSGGEARHRRTYQVTSSVAGVREYVTGDGFNRIHWPTDGAAEPADGQGVRAGPDRRRVDLS
jgi:uncharacterized protein (DUF58 family)